MELGKRIMIIGSGGAGKSAVARELGDLLALPVIHLDAEHWQPGWVETPKEEWQRKVEALAQRDCWIIDGNYGGTMHIRLAAADTVLFLDYPWHLCLWRVLKRFISYHGKSRPDIGPGCPEGFHWAFLRWVCVDFPRRSRPRILQLLEQHKDGRRIIVHRSPRETRRFLATLAPVEERIDKRT
jgi:adenylate kinase family enzyme